MPDADVVLTERRGRVLLITLNRPEVRNAVTSEIATGVAAALDELDGDDGLTAGVLTGAGRGFCAGMDLRARLEGDFAQHPERGFAGIARKPSRKPLVAAVEGFAVAGGLEIALACDLMVVARGALLGIPEVKRSLVAAAGGMRRLPQRIPPAVAMEMALTGAPITAERGYELGLVNRLVDPGGALEGALALATEIGANGPLAVAASKHIMSVQRDWSDEEFWERQMEIARAVMDSADAREGATAFIEKRAPQWRGR